MLTSRSSGANVGTPFHNPNPLDPIAQPQLGWSFNIPGDDARWNHFYPDDSEEPELGGLVLDTTHEDMCDHDPGGESGEYCIGIGDCEYAPPDHPGLGGVICQDPLLPVDFEWFSREREVAPLEGVGAPVRYMNADWSCPGQQFRTPAVQQYDNQDAEVWDSGASDECSPALENDE